MLSLSAGVIHGACLLYVLCLAAAGYIIAKAAAGKPYG
jgi:hypothetical protein